MLYFKHYFFINNKLSQAYDFAMRCTEHIGEYTQLQDNSSSQVVYSYSHALMYAQCVDELVYSINVICLLLINIRIIIIIQHYNISKNENYKHAAFFCFVFFYLYVCFFFFFNNISFNLSILSLEIVVVLLLYIAFQLHQSLKQIIVMHYLSTFNYFKVNL